MANMETAASSKEVRFHDSGGSLLLRVPTETRMLSRPWRYGLGVFLLMAFANAIAKENIQCSDGEHFKIEIDQIAIKYNATGFSASLNGLLNLGGQLKIEPKTLQIASAATQQWNEYLKGIVVGYNNCAITKAQYQEGLTQIYPRLSSDSKALEELRQVLSNKGKVDEQRLDKLIKSYEKALKHFASLSGKSIEYKRIESVVISLLQPINQTQNLLAQQNQQIEKRLTELSKRLEQLSKPEQVKPQIAALKQQLQTITDKAEAEYNAGYALAERYQFAEAIPHFSKAVEAVNLPEFDFALANAYLETREFDKAELTVKNGLAQVSDNKPEEAKLSFLLAEIFGAKDDIGDALRYAAVALSLYENVPGPENAETGRVLDYFAAMLLEKGDKKDFDTALQYAQRSLKIAEMLEGKDGINVATPANRVANVLWLKDNTSEAIQYAQRALALDEKYFGLSSYRVADDTHFIGKMFREKDSYAKALQFTQRSLAIWEELTGGESFWAATIAGDIADILVEKIDYDEELTYAMRPLRGPEKLPDSKGALNEALSYSLRALKGLEQLYDSRGPLVRYRADRTSAILQREKNYSEALKYSEQALRIAESELDEQTIDLYKRKVRYVKKKIREGLN